MLKGGVSDYDTLERVFMEVKIVHSKHLLKCSPKCVRNPLSF